MVEKPENTAVSALGMRLKLLRSMADAARFRPLATRVAVAGVRPHGSLTAPIVRRYAGHGAAPLRRLTRRLPRPGDGALGRRVSPLVEMLARGVTYAGEALLALTDHTTLLDAALLVPHRRDVAVVVIDMRNFSRLTAEIDDTEYLTRLIEEYLTRMTAVIEYHSGVVFQYTGDGLLAVFLPELSDETPEATLARLLDACTVDLHAEFDTMVERWRADWRRTRRTGYGVGLGVGVSYGPSTIGLIGSTGKKQFSVIGAPVNVAAFLCSQAAAGTVLVDSASLERTGVKVARSRKLRLRSHKLHQRIGAEVVRHGGITTARRIVAAPERPS